MCDEVGDYPNNLEKEMEIKIMLVNLSKSSHYRSEIQIHKKILRKYYDYTRDETKEIKFETIFVPTQYVGIYKSRGNEDTIKGWCKQKPVYYKFFRKVRKAKESGMTTKEICEMERNAWDFGVADNLEQIIEYYNNGNFKGNHVVFYNVVKRNSANAGCGWRWHKWGSYIGTRNPQCEYLNDEPEIEQVLTFSIYKVN